MQDNSSDLDPQVIFGDLLSRLHAIRNSTFDYLGVYHPPHQLHTIDRDGFKLKSSVALSYLRFSISLVKDIQNNIDSILNKIVFKEESKPGTNWFENSITSDEVKARVRASLEAELETYINRLEALQESHIRLSDGTDTEDSAERRIKLNMTVPEFAALVRLLNEYSLINESNTKNLCRLLAKSFITSGGGPTADSLYNDYRDFLSKGFDFWDENHTKIFGNIGKLRNNKPLFINKLAK
jgi:hypothetical protein